MAKPTVADATGGRTTKGKRRPNECGLAKAATMWPTPTTADSHGHAQVGWAKTPGQTGGTTLTGAVRFGTPTARNQVRSQSHRTGRTPNPGETAGGPLNPTWVEWLMGFPLGWTDSKPLATESFPQWSRCFSRCSD